MSRNRLDISESTAISMPMKNLISIVIAVAVGAWAYFGVLERITMLETKSTLSEKDLNQHVERIGADLEKNTEFRIKWPRGEMGQIPADSEQYMLIEFLSGQVEEIISQQAGMMNNSVNIKRLQADIEKLLDDVEELKDKIRATNGYNSNKSEN